MNELENAFATDSHSFPSLLDSFLGPISDCVIQLIGTCAPFGAFASKIQNDEAALGVLFQLATLCFKFSLEPINRYFFFDLFKLSVPC